MRPMRLRTIAATSGPPARPRRTGIGIFPHGERPDAEQDPERDAEEHRDEIGAVQIFDRIAENLTGFRDVLLLSDHLQHVAELDAKSGDGAHFHIGPRNAGDGDAVALGEFQFANRVAEDIRARHHESRERHGPGCIDQIVRALAADDEAEVAQGLRGADGEDGVALVQHGLGVCHGDFRFTSVADAGNDDAQMLLAWDFVEPQAGEVRIADPDVHSHERLLSGIALLFKRPRLRRWIDAQQGAKQEHREDDADDPKWVCHGVSECREAGTLRAQRGGLFQGFLRCAECGGVCGGSCENPDRGGHVDAGDPRYKHCEEGAEQDDCEGEKIQRQSLFAE